ncbi:hypothetical protein [Achromobacter ruhlandii]|uniref:hypothetical protein n=1 Tax=Achromobacter ruhlandii TaxID=72557 RepID=UPI000C2578C3|nr:hypothetical protein [Achromobacter ruhlandii]PJM69199.1 hypothetical protein CV751_15325 [Achromobacter ruhlandii]
MTGYFAPSVGQTVNTSIGVTGDPDYRGAPRCIAVVSDWGQRLDVFLHGCFAWSRSHTDTWLRGLAFFKGLIYYCIEDYILIRDPLTGFSIAQFQLSKIVGGQRKAINSIRFSEVGGNVYLTVCYDFSGIGSVVVYRYSGGRLLPHYENPLFASAPRGAYFDGRLVVADTFGAGGDGLGSVYLVNPATGTRITWTNVYYPNTVEPASGGRVLICAEHENRVFEWDPATGARIMRMSAPHPLFATLSNTATMIEAGQTSTAGPTPPTPPKSVCAEEHAGEWTLYSPNSARYGRSEDEMIISDTDNNRVIIVCGGEIKILITGFNNPVNAVLLD